MSEEKSKYKELVAQARKDFEADSQADHSNRLNAMEDLKFLHIPGAQWEELTKKERGLRPMYEFNKTRITVKRVVNDMRSNRPAGKVRAVEDADKDTAEIYEGLIRNIWNDSDGDTAIDHAAEYQVGGGMGAWRIRTEYSDDTAFDQDIKVEHIRNPFCLYWDLAATDPIKRDARRWHLTTRIPKEEYERTYKDKEPVDFDAAEFDTQDQWVDDNTVRVCEYWYKQPYKKRIVMLNTGETLDATEWSKEEYAARQPTIVKEREVNSHKIMMCIIGGGDTLLAEPVEWAGSKFPFVVVFGEEIFVEGRFHWFGLTRFAKDAQRAYNYSRTNAIESVALAPQAKWWATPEQALGHTLEWATAHKENVPFMLYNADPKAGGPPVRMGGADVPMALVQEMQIASDDIKAVTGIFDASIGKQGNETSGVAIRNRANQGEIVNFNYMDNLAKGVAYTWELLIDLIPKIYDTTRAVRILGADGAEKYAKVNHTDPITGKTENDLGVGKYDATITVGPSFSTQRQEAAEIYGQMAQGNPEVMQVAGDLIFKSMDLPYANEIAERIKAILPPPIQQLINKDTQQPPEVQAAMQQVQQAMQQVQQHGQMVQAAAQEAQAEKSDADKAKADVQIAIANLKVQEAKLAQAEAEFKQLVAETQLKMGEGQQTQEAANERIQLEAQVQEALAQIQQQAALFGQQSVELMTRLHEATQPQVIVHNPPKRKRVTVQRINGQLVGDVQELPDTPEQAMS